MQQSIILWVMWVLLMFRLIAAHNFLRTPENIFKQFLPLVLGRPFSYPQSMAQNRLSHIEKGTQPMAATSNVWICTIGNYHLPKLCYSHGLWWNKLFLDHAIRSGCETCPKYFLLAYQTINYNKCSFRVFSFSVARAKGYKRLFQQLGSLKVHRFSANNDTNAAIFFGYFCHQLLLYVC